MSLTYFLGPDGIAYVPVTAANPLPVTGGGGGGDAAGVGAPTDAAWTGSGDASLVSIMKAIYAIQQAIDTDTNEIVQDMSVVRALLEDIKTNTTPAG